MELDDDGRRAHTGEYWSQTGDDYPPEDLLHLCSAAVYDFVMLDNYRTSEDFFIWVDENPDRWYL